MNVIVLIKETKKPGVLCVLRNLSAEEAKAVGCLGSLASSPSMVGSKSQAAERCVPIKQD